MKDRMIAEAVEVLQLHPEGLYCSHLMQRIRENCPALAHESFGFYLRNWKKEDASSPAPLLATHDETGFFQLAPSALPPVETYTGEELAVRLDVHPATLAEWKEAGKIPERFMTPDGHYIKSLIDPLIEAFCSAAHATTTEASASRSMSEEDRLQIAILYEEGLSVPEIALRFHCEPDAVFDALHHFGVADDPKPVPQATVNQPSGRTYLRKKIRFTADDHDRMARMRAEGRSLETIASSFGCSISTISRVLSSPDARTSSLPVVESPDTPVHVAPVPEPAAQTAPIAFEEFVRNYWSVGTRAVDMLFLPPEARSRILSAVRETLRYAYERLRGDDASEPDEEKTHEMPALLPFLQSMGDAPSQCDPIRQAPSQATTGRRGRPKGSGKYGCETKAIRVPAHLVAQVKDYAQTKLGSTTDSESRTYKRRPK